MSLPIFTDEAIYTRWSQIARYDSAWRFISLTDGKQPLFVWLDVVVMHFFKDPLFSGRLVSVLAGFGTMVGLFFLGKEIFKNIWVGILSSFLYLVYPFGLVYDRMALYDSLVGALGVWGLYVEILLVRKNRLDIALILGMVMGGGLLTKTSLFFNIYLLPFTLLLFDWKGKEVKKRLFKWISLAVIAIFLSYGYYSVLRLSPFFNIIGEKNSIFVYPLRDWISHPFNFLFGNLHGLLDWLISYFKLPLLSLVALSLFLKKNMREKFLLLLWFAIPFIALALFGRTLYPRFILFMTLPLLPLVALSLQKLFLLSKNKFAGSLIIFLFLLLSLRADYYIVSDFARAPIASPDLEQYINNWPSGGGVTEIINYLNKESKSHKIYVASEGTFGSLPTYAVEIYLGDNKNVDKKGIWPVPSIIPQDLLDKAKLMPVYFISDQTQIPPPGWPLELVAKYQKGIGNSYMFFYRVVSK